MNRSDIDVILALLPLFGLLLYSIIRTLLDEIFLGIILVLIIGWSLLWVWLMSKQSKKEEEGLKNVFQSKQERYNYQ